MLLARLAEYERRMAAEDTEELPSGYNWVRVLWLAELDGKGVLQGFTNLAGDKGPERRGKPFAAPDALGTVNITAKLLTQKADYVFGVAPKDANERQKERAVHCHRAFVGLIRECAEATQEGSVLAVQLFLESFDAGKFKLPEKMTSADVVTFRVDGLFPIDLPQVRDFWSGRGKGEAAEKGTCLVCGMLGPIARIHDVKIKGIPEGQTSGTSLVSFNAAAFESYGLEQSYGAPVCDSCSEAYAKGLNRLIRDEDTSLRIGATCYVFWTREPETFNPATLFKRPYPQQVQALFEAASHGKRSAPEIVNPNAFYAACLSASGGRAVVRDWLETTVSTAMQNVARFFKLQRIAPLYGDDLRYFSIRELAQSLVPKSLPGRPPASPPPDVTPSLLHVALLGGALPEWLLFQAVRRNLAEQGPLGRNPQGRPAFWERVALIKMVLQSQANMELDEEGNMDSNTQQLPAYLCGRLLSLVEHAQTAALNDPNASVVDRFYGSASSAPASVFGLLIRNAQHHLSKLKDQKPGIHYHVQRDLEEVMSQLRDFPLVLNLREQGLFALGYYYQRVANFRKRSDDKPAGTAASQNAEEEKSE